MKAKYLPVVFHSYSSVQRYTFKQSHMRKFGTATRFKFLMFPVNYPSQNILSRLNTADLRAREPNIQTMVVL